MTRPQEFLQPPGLSLGQEPEGAGGPGQGEWEMNLVSWQTQSGGQGPLRLGRQVEQWALVMGFGPLGRWAMG